ncbi:MAG: SDR family oxidoreductase, partial [Sphingobacteriales bacterium]
LDTDDFSLTMEQMAFSLHSWTMAMLGAGLFAEDARVLAFTSEGSHRAIRNYAAVSAAKAAMEAIIRSMAMELAPRGIRANAIQAGITPTASMQRIPGSGDMEAFALSRNPFGRLTHPDDVANVVCLLCTDEAAWINGAIIPVDGGEQIC